MQGAWFLIMLSVFWITACDTSQPDVGIGLVHFENDFTTVVKFYDKPQVSGEPAFSASLIYEDDTVFTKTTLKKEDVLKFNPIYLSSGKSILVLQVMEEKGGWLKVITDETNKQEHWIKPAQTKIDTWPDFLKLVKQVKPLRSDQNPLRKAPINGKVLPLSFRITCFSITSVNGDWVRVENRSENCPEPGISDYPYVGFLRWKKEGDILIDFLP